MYNNQILKCQSFVRIICTGSHGGFVKFVISLLAVLSVLLFVRLNLRDMTFLC